MFSMFELATQDEIDKLRTNDAGTDKKSSDDLQLEDLEVKTKDFRKPFYNSIFQGHRQNPSHQGSGESDSSIQISLVRFQMFFISEWSLMLFLACPIMKVGVFHSHTQYDMI